MGLISSISSAFSNATDSAKDAATKAANAAANSKDAKNMGGNLNNFVDQSEGGAVRFWNALTGEVVEGEAAVQIKTLIDESKPVPENTTTINPGSVEPTVASQNALYVAKANSESFEVEKPGKANTTETIEGKKDVPFSLFNHWSLMNYAGGPLESFNDYTHYNGPLGSGSNLEAFRNPTATYIINQLNEKNNPGYKYSFADFALAKHYGDISNNYMVTLRRFPMPVEDNIINPNIIGPDGSVIPNAMPDLARAVSWMSDSTGNKLDDILKFNVSTTWEEVKSKIQELGQEDQGGKLGGMIKGNSFASAALGAANGMDAVATRNAKTGYDATKGTYPNHVFGPINVIDKVMVRQAGLNFTGDFSLSFHYSLRQLDGVSPKIAFLDLFANLLVLTYNNGNFWGGSSRYIGGSGAFNKPFGDFEKLKAGDFGGFLGSIGGDLLDGATNVISDIKNNGLSGSKLGKNLIGGALMDMFGTPQGSEALNAFLTGDPTGQYHVTIGNPLNPIAVIGNLYCDSTDFKFGGELSYEGFPTELTVTVSLKPARPRDKADIERMFNGGKERMYLTPEGGVDTNQNTNNSAYGNADSPQQTDIYRKMTNG